MATSGDLDCDTDIGMPNGFARRTSSWDSGRRVFCVEGESVFTKLYKKSRDSEVFTKLFFLTSRDSEVFTKLYKNSGDSDVFKTLCRNSRNSQVSRIPREPECCVASGLAFRGREVWVRGILSY